MLERLREAVPPELRGVIDSELAELRVHRFRVGLMALTLLVLLIILMFDDDKEASRQAGLAEGVTSAVEEPVVERSSVERVDRRTEIIGLAKASEDVKLINPFAADLPKPPPEPLIIPVTAPPPPPRLSAPLPTVAEPKAVEKTEAPLRVMLTLQGTAIGDDKKFAVVHREVVSNKNKSDAASEERGKNHVENRLLKIGETIDGREVVDIGRDYVEFDDGGRLELTRVQNDD